MMIPRAWTIYGIPPSLLSPREARASRDESHVGDHREVVARELVIGQRGLRGDRLERRHGRVRDGDHRRAERGVARRVAPHVIQSAPEPAHADDNHAATDTTAEDAQRPRSKALRRMRQYKPIRAEGLASSHLLYEAFRHARQRLPRARKSAAGFSEQQPEQAEQPEQ